MEVCSGAVRLSVATGTASSKAVSADTIRAPAFSHCFSLLCLSGLFSLFALWQRRLQRLYFCALLLRSTSALFCLQLHFSAVIFSARILALLLCGRIFGAQFFPLAVQPFTFAPALYFLRLLGCNCMHSLSASTFSASISVLYFCALLSALFFHSPSELYVLRSYFQTRTGLSNHPILKIE